MENQKLGAYLVIIRRMSEGVLQMRFALANATGNKNKTLPGFRRGLSLQKSCLLRAALNFLRCSVF